MEVLTPAITEILKIAASLAFGALTTKLAVWAKRRRDRPLEHGEYIERQIQRVIEEKDEAYARRNQEWGERMKELREELQAYRDELRRRDQFEAEQAKQISELIRRLKNGNGGHAPNPPAS